MADADEPPESEVLVGIFYERHHFGAIRVLRVKAAYADDWTVDGRTRNDADGVNTAEELGRTAYCELAESTSTRLDTESGSEPFLSVLSAAIGSPGRRAATRA
jgi:hypothetical protein